MKKVVEIASDSEEETTQESESDSDSQASKYDGVPDETADEDEENEEESEDPEPESEEVESNAENDSEVERKSLKKNVDKSQYMLSSLKDKLKKNEAVKRFKHLLGISDLLRHFIQLKADEDPFYADVLSQAASELKKRQRSSARGSNRAEMRHSRVVDQEPENEIDEDKDLCVSSPSWLKGTLREYQIEGLNWMISSYKNQISGILADEMGLGKTLQTIAFLGWLRYTQGITGPHLILVPKSTVDNWAREFARFTPEVNVLVITGDKYERADLIENRLLTCEFDVVITSFELVIREQKYMKRFAWQYLIVDEAHRIKNEDSMLSRIVRVLFSHNRLLITGTPLQNNLHELWALLNFLLPDVFSSSEMFDEWFLKPRDQDEDGEDGEEEDHEENRESSDKKEATTNGTSNGGEVDKDALQQGEAIEQLHRLLRPFLLRRVKAEVETSLLPKIETNIYVGLTNMQVDWYRKLLENDIDTVNSAGKRDTKAKKLLNVVMQLRKCCNHPYLFDGAEPGPPYTTGEHIVQNSAKMIILDKLLKKLKAQGSRVLIFSQMTLMLDILEDYCALRDYEYCRIDGSTIHEDRISAIDEFNKPKSDKFIFLLTTRAGGLGINLTTADQVILYDSDWNPQADLQAMDRAHRIGQTKQVHVYRFVTENAIEEKVLEKAARKLRLDQLVIQQARKNSGNSALDSDKKASSTSKGELVDMIRHGAQSVFDRKEGTFKDDSIENILKRGQVLTQELSDKYAGYGLDEINRKFTFKFDHGPVIQKPAHLIAQEEEDSLKHPHMRRARVDYALDKERRGARAPRHIPLHDFQFFPRELKALQDKERLYYRKQAGHHLQQADEFSDEEDNSQGDSLAAEIENAQPLTEEEKQRKEELINEGFINFTKRDFHHFINLMVKNGKNNIDGIVEDWPDKDPEEVRRYFDTFNKRYQELHDWNKYINQVEAGETKAKTQVKQSELLRRKVGSCPCPLSDMQIVYPVSNTKKAYTEEEDRFLLVQLNDIGIDTPGVYEIIRDRIRSCGLFEFDWYFLSRTPTELGRRCATLLLVVMREFEGPGALKRRTRGKHEDNDTDGNTSKRAKASTPI